MFEESARMKCSVELRLNFRKNAFCLGLMAACDSNRSLKEAGEGAPSTESIRELRGSMREQHD